MGLGLSDFSGKFGGGGGGGVWGGGGGVGREGVLIPVLGLTSQGRLFLIFLYIYIYILICIYFFCFVFVVWGGGFLGPDPGP